MLDPLVGHFRQLISISMRSSMRAVHDVNACVFRGASTQKKPLPLPFCPTARSEIKTTFRDRRGEVVACPDLPFRCGEIDCRASE